MLEAVAAARAPEELLGEADVAAHGADGGGGGAGHGGTQTWPGGSEGETHGRGSERERERERRGDSRGVVVRMAESERELKGVVVV